MKISFNARIILSFCFIAVIVRTITYFVPDFTTKFFVVGSTMDFRNPWDYFRLFSHVLGHGSWEHLMANLPYVLLLGPILEEKYGGMRLLLIILFTAGITGIFNVLLFSTGLLGASGIVFMLIILVSFTGKKDNSIPVEFLLVALFFLGGEVIRAFRADQISQMGHVVGGMFGAVFGFEITKSKEVEQVSTN